MITLEKEDNRPVLTIEEFLKVANAEQKKLLLDLYDLARKESDIVGKINGIYESIDKGTYYNDEGITICESRDDADVISLGLKVELKAVQVDVGRLLKKAIDKLDMGNVGMIRRQYKNYVT